MVSRSYDYLAKFPPDLTIQTSDRTFSVHQTILCCGSGYFRTRHAGGWKNDGPLQLPDIPGDSFQLILNILYEDEFPELDTVEDYHSFLQYLDYFDIKLERPLLFVTDCSGDVLLEMIKDGTITKGNIIGVLSHIAQRGPIPQALMLEIYRRELLKMHDLKDYLDLVEDRLDTRAKLYDLGMDPSWVLYNINTPELKQDLIAVFTKLGISTDFILDQSLMEQSEGPSRVTHLYN